MQPLPRIPGYELLKRLGGGPLTEVYSARSEETDQHYAVKVLRPNWEDQPLAIKLIQREARAGLSVAHPHLVAFEQAHVTRSPWFLVMELLPGESLRRRLRRDYQLDTATAVWIARQIGEALAALHRAGFVHGDVKPDNIRLVNDGTAKLLDLGFAHRPGENASMLEEGYLLGTASYLAPEVCACDPWADQSSDVFSFGVLLFEMLTGRLPYPNGNVEQTLRRHRFDPPAPLRSCLPEAPRELCDLMDRLLAREGPDRPRMLSVVRHLVALEIRALGRRKAA